MNNIPINTNNDNKENEVKKPSRKKKVMTVLLIVMIVLFLANTLTKITVGADNNERVNLLNSITYLDIETDFYTVQADDYSNSSSRMAGNIWLKPNEPSWFGTPTYHSDTLKNWIDFPSFYFYPDDFKINNLSSTTAIYIYYALVLKSDVHQITPISYFLTYNITSSGASSTTTLVSYTSTEYTILIHAIGQYTNKVTSRVDINELRYEFPVSGNTLTFDVVGGVVGTSVADVINNAIAIRDDDLAEQPPVDVVYGTDKFTVTNPNNTQTTYSANEIHFPWDNGYVGVIGRVKTADGVSIPVMYSVQIDGLLQTGSSGTWVVLDPNYHDYVIPVEIYGGQDNYGYVDITVDNTMEVVYIACSDNYDMLSSDLIDKVNKYHLIQEEINQAYLDGYTFGYKEGLKNGSIGPFANATMTVVYNFKDLATNEISEYPVNFPLEVNSGGISFEQIWYWYSNSEANNRNTAISSIDVYIYFNKPLLWKNTLFYYGNNNNDVNMIPNYTYVRFVGTSGDYIRTTTINTIGDYFYLTLNESEYTSIDRINFTITNASASYYDIFVDNKLTLYTDINQTIIDEVSYLLGEENGYDNGYEKGEKVGYDIGYDKAYEDSKRDFYEKGFEAGKEEGYDVGFLRGREQGMNEVFSFYMIPTSIMDAISSTFFGWLDFEFFGVNMASFVLQLMTIAVFAWVWKKVA